MSPRNNIYTMIREYRDLIKTRVIKGKWAGCVRNGNRTKNKVLDFYVKNGRWPSRNSSKAAERRLGATFENYTSKESGTYDSAFRDIVVATGRVSNNKRKHNVDGFKQEILDFIQEHGRAPTTYAGAKIEGEGRLRQKLDYYTLKNNDMTLLGKVYETDKCHRSGIPAKFRPVINEAIGNVSKPLIRLV